MKSAVRLASKAPTSGAEIGEIFVMLNEGTQPEEVDLRSLRETIKLAIEEAQDICETAGGNDCPDRNHSWSYAVVGATADDADDDGRFSKSREIITGAVRQIPKGKKFKQIAKENRAARKNGESNGYCPAGWTICDSSAGADEPATEFQYLITVIDPRNLAPVLAAELRALDSK
jgi:hypothetical protein